MQIVIAGIMQDGNGRCLLCQRGKADNWALKWEFPGGKLEAGETAAECLVREIREELCLEVRVTDHVCDVVYQYATGQISLRFFRVEITGGRMQLMVHNAVAWVYPDDMLQYDLLPADVEIVEKLRSDSGK